MGRSFAVFLVVAWCACANSSKDVEELYDDLGPHRVLDAPRSTARGDSVGRLKSRPILGESSQTGSSMEAEKQESWACRESKRCGCAEGVELEDLQLLQESFFSQKDELVFLQVGSSSSKWHKEAAAFSGYKSRKPQAAVDSSSEPKKALESKSEIMVGPDLGVSLKSTVQEVLAHMESKQATAAVKSPVKEKKAAPSTKGISKTLEKAREKSKSNSEKEVVLDQKKGKQCITFCADLAQKAANRVRQLKGKQGENAQKDRDDEEKKEMTSDEKDLKNKKLLLNEQRQDADDKKLAAVKQKRKIATDKLSDSKAQLEDAEVSEKISSHQLNRLGSKVEQKLDALRGTKQKVAKAAQMREADRAKAKKIREAVLKKEQPKAAALKAAKATLQKQVKIDQVNADQQEKKVAKANEEKTKAEAQQAKTEKKTVKAEKKKAKADAKAQFANQDAKQAKKNAEQDAKNVKKEKQAAKTEKNEAKADEEKANKAEGKAKKDQNKLKQEESKDKQQKKKDKNQVEKDKEKKAGLKAKGKDAASKVQAAKDKVHKKKQAVAKDQKKVAKDVKANAKAKINKQQAKAENADVKADKAKLAKAQESAKAAEDNLDGKKKSAKKADQANRSIVGKIQNMKTQKKGSNCASHPGRGSSCISHSRSSHHRKGAGCSLCSTPIGHEDNR